MSWVYSTHRGVGIGTRIPQSSAFRRLRTPPPVFVTHPAGDLFRTRLNSSLASFHRIARAPCPDSSTFDLQQLLLESPCLAHDPWALLLWSCGPGCTFMNCVPLCSPGSGFAYHYYAQSADLSALLADSICRIFPGLYLQFCDPGGLLTACSPYLPTAFG